MHFTKNLSVFVAGLADRNRLKEIDEALASGKITLDRYEEQKADIQKLIAEYQEKLEDKSINSMRRSRKWNN